MSSTTGTTKIKQEEVEELKSTNAKTDPEIIEQAMLWHRRMGHANYHTVKMMPQNSRGMGVDFTNLNVEDMPPCDACQKAGMDPHSLDEA